MNDPPQPPGLSDPVLVFYVVAGCAVVLTLLAVAVFVARPRRRGLVLGAVTSVVAVGAWVLAWLQLRIYEATWDPTFPPPLGRAFTHQQPYLPYAVAAVLVLTAGLVVAVGWRGTWRRRHVDVLEWEGGPMGRYLRLRYLGEDSEAGDDRMHGGRAADSR